MSMFAAILSRPEFRSMKVSLPVGQWMRVARERRALAMLSDHELRDIGLEPDVAAREAARPFWDLPEGRS